MIKVLVVDNHPIVTTGFELFFRNHETIEVVGTLSNGVDIFDFVRNNPVNVIIAETGTPLVRTYSPLEYNGHIDNYDAVQGPDGVMYFANGDGVLTFDGARWELIQTPEHFYVQAVSISADGVVFTGGLHDLGYLAPGGGRENAFVSLRHLLPEGAPDTFDIEWIHATPNGVLFNAGQHLFRWDGERFYVWSADEPFGASALVSGRWLVGSADGLMELRGDSLHLLRGSDMEGEIEVIARHDVRRLLLGTHDRLMVYDGQTLAPFTDAKTLGTDAPFSALVALGDGTFALGTAGGGVFQLSSDGQLLRVIDESSGLRTNSVRALSPEAGGGVWVSQNDGLAWFDARSTLTSFGPSDGLRGRPGEVVRHQGRLYVGTSDGVFRLAAGRPARFEAVTSAAQGNYALLSHGTHLLALGTSGLYQIEELSGKRIADLSGFALAALHGEPAAVLAGGPDGLYAMSYDADRQRWSVPSRVASFEGGVREITPSAQGGYWVVVVPDGLSRVTFPDGPDQPAHVEHFGPDENLPNGELVVAPSPGGDLISALDGLFRLDESAHRFVRDSRMGPAMAAGDTVLFDPVLTHNGIWSSIIRGDANASLEVRRYVQTTSGHYEMDPLVGLRLMPNVYALDFHVDGGGARSVAWVAATEGLYRYDPTLDALGPPPRPLVRAVEIGDSLLFAGTRPDGAALPTIQAGHDVLRFQYALPSFADPERTRYQVRLDGFDDRWSDWTEETRKDYTNLSGGDYTFQVRARDVYGRVTQADAFALVVRSAWYLTGWAYVLYLMAGLGVVAGVFRWRLRSLNARAHLLERTVAERTAQIAEQAGRLEQLDIAKSRFFANVSHELRTPLTLMLGPLSQLHDESERTQSPQVQEQLSMVLRNGQRLQRLVNQILDLAKLEAGSVRFDHQPGDLVAYVRQHVELYAGLADYQGIDLSSRAEVSACVVAFDQGQMEKVLANLLSNALKFTDSGGRVEVVVDQDAGHAVISVADTGLGIAADKLPHVFDRFYQVEDSATRTYEGTGIGLALAKELVDLHGGTLSVASEEGKGSTFTVRLPLAAESIARAHVAPHPVVAVAQRTSAPSLDEPSGDGHIETHQMDDPALTTAATEREERSDDDQTTILVVEDNADMRVFIRSILEPHYKVVEAVDGEDGLGQARASLPDLILSDVMMPRMDGLAMSRALREDPETNSIPLVLLTARAGQEDRIDGLETGANAYLVKPFDARALRLQVGNLIERQQRLRERLRAEPSQAPSPLPVATPDPLPPSALEVQVTEAIEQHMADPQFSVEVLAGEVGLSRQQLHRRLKEDAGVTPVAYIRAYRLERAARLLRERQGNVTEVAYAVGFNSLSYFTRCFGDHFDQTPSAYVAQSVAE